MMQTLVSKSPSLVCLTATVWKRERGKRKRLLPWASQYSRPAIHGRKGSSWDHKIDQDNAATNDATTA